MSDGSGSRMEDLFEVDRCWRSEVMYLRMEV
jgi:hypothetical protein